MVFPAKPEIVAERGVGRVELDERAREHPCGERVVPACASDFLGERAGRELDTVHRNGRLDRELLRHGHAGAGKADGNDGAVVYSVQTGR